MVEARVGRRPWERAAAPFTVDAFSDLRGYSTVTHPSSVGDRSPRNSLQQWLPSNSCQVIKRERESAREGKLNNGERETKRARGPLTMPLFV